MRKLATCRCMIWSVNFIFCIISNQLKLQPFFGGPAWFIKKFKQFNQCDMANHVAALTMTLYVDCPLWLIYTAQHRDWWSFQTELERDRYWELNQDKWVLRYYVILSHCNWSGIGIRTGNLWNGFLTHSTTYLVTLEGTYRGTYGVLYSNLYVCKFLVPVPFPLQCERVSIILVKFPVLVPVMFKLCLNRPWYWDQCQ